VIGPGGSVLRSILGEDPLVTVSIGKKDGKTDQDVIVVRGPSTEVDRIVPALLQVVEDAKNDDIVNGHTIEFSVEKRHVPHLVGQAGATINKLRESLGVRVNFDDDEEPSNKKGSKNPMVSCKIVGRKEAVEEAKQRLQAQIERLADETTEVITIKRALHPALIGSSGKYAIRLEDKYGVKITFPRDTKDGAEQKANQKPDEVVIRGGKKGVAGAKAELLEAAEFEKETNQTITFTVPTTAVARILGKAGANINAIKDDTGAQIDVDKTSEKDTSITLRGDKQAIAAAKSSIQAVVAEVGDRKEEVITIPNKFVSGSALPSWSVSS
jgi:predicted PilT family ATPase